MKPLADRIYEEIEVVLQQHRLSNMQTEDGDAYPLTDALTSCGRSIQDGYDEIRLICDSIYNRVLTPHFNNVDHVSDDLIVDTWASMPNGYDGFRKSWGFVQFARNLLERVLPRQKPMKPRAWLEVDSRGKTLGVTDNRAISDMWRSEGRKVIPLFTEILESPAYPTAPTSISD